MTYNPIPRDDEILKEILANPEAKKIYEETLLEINKNTLGGNDEV